MINDKYLYGVAKLMVGESYAIPTYISFGSDDVDVAATDTFVAGEFDRVVTTANYSDGAIAKFIGFRNAIDANNEYVNIVGLHNTSTLAASGDLQANFLVSSLLHTTDFDISIEFWVRANRG